MKMSCTCGNLLVSSLNGGGGLFREVCDYDSGRFLEVWECDGCGMLIVFKEDDNKVIERYLPEGKKPLNLLEGLK